MRYRIWAVLALLLVAGCGGGGGGSAPFVLSGSSPEPGSTEASYDAPVLLVFNRPADLESITRATITFEEEDGTSVPFEVVAQGFNASSVSISPLGDLKQNVKHTIRLSSAIRSADGANLKGEVICFVTRSENPTVRPDQLIDLGDALNVPRYLAAQVELADGRVLIIGGYTDPQAATDTIEIYDPATRTFRLLDARLTVPRAEHTATLLLDGRVVIAGGVSAAGAAPLASVDILQTARGTIAPGPDLLDARRSHAASTFRSGEAAMVSGGFDADGNEMSSVERFVAGAWSLLPDPLAVPSVNGVQINHDYDKVYFSGSNLSGVGGYFDGVDLIRRQESDIRFRAAFARIGSGRFLIVGGDTRSALTFDFSRQVGYGGTDFLFERRGAHSLTPRGLSGRRLLVAGGFNVAQLGSPALRTMEIVDAVDPGRFGNPDVLFYRVDGVLLPVPFAGHVGFAEPAGPTVLAGGWGDGVGPHSRRVVRILDNASSDTVDCR